MGDIAASRLPWRPSPKAGGVSRTFQFISKSLAKLPGNFVRHRRAAVDKPLTTHLLPSSPSAPQLRRRNKHSPLRLSDDEVSDLDLSHLPVGPVSGSSINRLAIMHSCSLKILGTSMEGKPCAFESAFRAFAMLSCPTLPAAQRNSDTNATAGQLTRCTHVPKGAKKAPQRAGLMIIA
jgi:hypothetical protein